MESPREVIPIVVFALILFRRTQTILGQIQNGPKMRPQPASAEQALLIALGKVLGEKA